MNRRSNKILNKLILGKKENVLELANSFQVQERTIRSEIRELNQDLQENQLSKIETNIDGDIWMEDTINISSEKFKKFILQYDYYTYYLSKNERQTVLAMILLNSREYTTLEMLGEKVGASKSTLLRDFGELKNWFFENDMKLVSQVRKGYRVEATEKKIQAEILKLLELNSDQVLYKDGHNLSVFWNLLLKEMDQINIFDKAREYLIEEEEVQKAFLTDFSFLEAVLELVIVINRISKGISLPGYYLEKLNYLKKSSKFSFSKNLFVRLSKEFNFKIEEMAVLNYTECLRRKSYMKDNSQSLDMFDIRILIGEIVYRISNSFEIDFYLDFALYDLLVDHMRSAVHRLQNDEILLNPLRNELEDTYPKLFQIVEKQIEPLEDYIGMKFSKDEMSFMVLYFASVIEKNKAESTKKRIVSVALVCATGRGTAQLMMARLKSLDNILEVVSVSSAHNINEIESSGAEMIVSTVPLTEIKIPCIQVSTPMLSDEDICDIQMLAMEVRNHFDGKRKNKGVDKRQKIIMDTEKNANEFTSLLSLEKIELDYEASNWESAVREAGRLLYESGAVEKKYIDAMVENIKKNGPYVVIYPEIAVPHADTEKGVREEAASIVRLKNPVEFHSKVNDPVRYVIGFSILSAQSINRAIYNMTMIFGNEEEKSKLDGIDNINAMLKELEQMEMRIARRKQNEAIGK